MCSEHRAGIILPLASSMLSDYQLRRVRYLAGIKGITGRAPAIEIVQPIPVKGDAAYVPKIQIPAGHYTDRARLGQYFATVNQHARGISSAIKTSKLVSSKRRVVITDAIPSPLGSDYLTTYPDVMLERAPVSQPLALRTVESETVVPQPMFKLDHTGRCVKCY